MHGMEVARPLVRTIAVVWRMEKHGPIRCHPLRSGASIGVPM